MKKIRIVITSIIIALTGGVISSCDQSEDKKTEQQVVENKGEVSVENGKGDLDTIKYTCIGCEKHLTFKLFEDIKKESTKRAQENLNNPLSFEPLAMEIMIIKKDSLYSFDTGNKIDSVLTVMTTYEYIGKNAYGTEMKGDQLITFNLVEGKIKDISEETKLDSLAFDDKYINRSLTLYDGDEFIRFTPTKKKSIIVESSLSCVEEDASFVITMENDEDITLYSWNEFNCDGISYFHWFNKDQVQEIEDHKIRYLYINSRGESVIIRVPKNESDYLQQLIELYD